MDDRSFIKHCYDKLLNRAPDEKGEAAYASALSKGLISREGVLLAFLESSEYEKLRSAREFVPPGHFYSALPSRMERESYRQSTMEGNEIPGVELRKTQQKELLTQFKRYYDELPFPELRHPDFRYYLSCPSYAYTDGLCSIASLDTLILNVLSRLDPDTRLA